MITDDQRKAFADLIGDSDDADQSFRFDADQIGAKRRRTLSVLNSDRHPSRVLLAFLVLMHRSCCLLGCWCFWALTEGARRATGVSAQKHFATCLLLAIFGTTSTPFLPHRLAL